MVAIENALATLQWKVQMLGEEGKTNSEQISDYLTDAEQNEHWPTMWRHRVWRTEQWKQEDKRERSHTSITAKREQEQRRELIRRAVELQELEIGEDEKKDWEEAVQQILREAEGLPGQGKEKTKCTECGKGRIVLNQQNESRKCEEIGRRCMEPADEGLRADYIHKAYRKIMYKDKERLNEHIESWRRELIRYMDKSMLKLNEVYKRNRKEHEQTKAKKWEEGRCREPQREDEIMAEAVEGLRDDGVCCP